LATDCLQLPYWFFNLVFKPLLDNNKVALKNIAFLQ
jgi:hypothetical protein